MSRIYKRGKTWSFCAYTGKDKDGKYNRKCGGGFRTKKEAEEAAAKVVSEVSDGTYIQEQSDTTFDQFSKDWLIDYAKAGHSKPVKKGTVRIRTHEVNKLKHYFNLIKMKDIKRKQYQNALYDLQERGFAENTISGVHSTARMLFGKAVELGVIKNDPTEYARPPKKQETLEDIETAEEIPKYLEKDELSTFLKIAHDAGLYADYTVFLLLAYTGIRIGELCALKESDVNFQASTLKITRTYYNPTNNIKKYELVPPKTKASRRSIEVSSKVMKELTLHIARQKKAQMKNKNIWHDKGFLFTSDKYPGYPAYVKLFEGRMARLLKISGLNPDLTPHSLRHTHTSLLAEAKVGLEEIMERLGHTDDDITRRIYLHVTKTMKKEAAHKFDQLMNGL
ncbi:site-specific integrase [Anaerospora hongkongensis]|uniref:tyrosine-type recombinase/integrase n=1 Tax=Anaerospora hongkongensis TaxID=244830 RepID=UPI002FDA1593